MKTGPAMKNNSK